MQKNLKNMLEFLSTLFDGLKQLIYELCHVVYVAVKACREGIDQSGMSVSTWTWLYLVLAVIVLIVAMHKYGKIIDQKYRRDSIGRILNNIPLEELKQRMAPLMQKYPSFQEYFHSVYNKGLALKVKLIEYFREQKYGSSNQYSNVTPMVDDIKIFFLGLKSLHKKIWILQNLLKNNWVTAFVFPLPALIAPYLGTIIDFLEQNSAFIPFISSWISSIKGINEENSLNNLKTGYTDDGEIQDFQAKILKEKTQNEEFIGQKQPEKNEVQEKKECKRDPYSSAICFISGIAITLIKHWLFC